MNSKEYLLYDKSLDGIWDLYIAFLLLNCTVHAIVDDLKANQLTINLVQDQSIHLLQIFATWLFWILV